MIRFMMIPIATTALLTAGAANAQLQMSNDDEGLAAATLADGENVRAIVMLQSALEEAPGDPGLLINLGIAYARGGNDTEARASFKKALNARQPIELETASEGTIDSRRLARKALTMLERGEFRAPPVQADTLTLRQ